jgi:hypothetical protein
MEIHVRCEGARADSSIEKRVMLEVDIKPATDDSRDRA